MFHRNTLSRMLHVLCGLVFVSWNTEAAITAWTVPVISNAANGAGVATPKIPESLTPGHLTGINITAISGTNNASITYVMLSQPVDGMFTINKTSGAIKFVKGVLDFEKIPSYVVRISASDTTANGTANVTLQLSNSPPVFSSKTYNKQMCDGAGAGTSVTTLKATDPGNSNVTYTFQAGSNTNGDFSINANTGVMTVTAKKSLNMTAKSTYSLVVQASDTASSPATGTSTVSVTVKTCSSGTSHIAVAFPVLLLAVLAKLF